MTDAHNKCAVCMRTPESRNNAMSECSHVDCPTRRKAWSERPRPEPMRRFPEPYRKGSDPKPLDKDLDKL